MVMSTFANILGFVRMQAYLAVQLHLHLQVASRAHTAVSGCLWETNQQGCVPPSAPELVTNTVSDLIPYVCMHSK